MLLEIRVLAVSILCLAQASCLCQKQFKLLSMWVNKPLSAFSRALEAFGRAISFRLVKWLNENWDVFSAYKASSMLCLGLKFV